MDGPLKQECIALPFGYHVPHKAGLLHELAQELDRGMPTPLVLAFWLLAHSGGESWQGDELGYLEHVSNQKMLAGQIEDSC